MKISNNNFLFAFRIVDIKSRNMLLNVNLDNFKMSHQKISEEDTVYTNITFHKCPQEKFALLEFDNKADFYCADSFTIKNQLIGGNYDTIDSFTGLMNFNIGIYHNILKLSLDKNTEEFLSLTQNGIYLEMLIMQPVFNPNDNTHPLKLEKNSCLQL